MLNLYTPPAATMTSLEISKVVESNHADVRRSIDRLATKGVITLPPLAEVSNDGPGPKTISVYHLDKRSSLIVVAQLCPEFTAKIVDRWQELEAQASKPFNPADLTRMDILKLAMDSEEARVKAEEARAQAEAKLAYQKPLVDAAVRLTKSDNTYCLTEAAKILKVKRQFLIDLMHMSKWIYRRSPKSEWLASDVKRHGGYLEHGYTHIETSTGSAFEKAQVRITERGMVSLASMCNTMQASLALAA